MGVCCKRAKATVPGRHRLPPLHTAQGWVSGPSTQIASSLARQKPLGAGASTGEYLHQGKQQIRTGFSFCLFFFFFLFLFLQTANLPVSRLVIQSPEASSLSPNSSSQTQASQPSQRACPSGGHGLPGLWPTCRVELPSALLDCPESRAQPLC